MKPRDIFARLLRVLPALPLALVVFGTSAAAERTVNANEPIVISDDILKTTTDVQSASGGSGDEDGNGNSNNRSGLGDGSNPNQGKADGKNDGTNNPNKARR